MIRFSKYIPTKAGVQELGLAILRRGRSFPNDFRLAFKRWRVDGGKMMAASTAFYAVFSLFPLLLVLTSLLGALLKYSPFVQGIETEMLDMAGEAFTPETVEFIEGIMRDVQSKAKYGGPIGALMLIYGAAAVFAQVDYGFRRIWHVPRKRKHWILPILTILMRKVRAILVLLGFGGLVIASYLSQPLMGALSAFLSDMPFAGAVTNLINIAGLAAMNVLSIMLVYKILPKVTIRWRDALSGALLTTVLWFIVRILLTILLRESKYTAYGLFGSIIILMYWFYIGAGIFYLGAEYVAVLGEKKKGQAEETHPT
jgi:membrane protein